MGDCAAADLARPGHPPAASRHEEHSPSSSISSIINSRFEPLTDRCGRGRSGAESVADFYREVLATLREMDLPVKIWPMAVEIPSPIRLDEDTLHHSYDPASATRFWRILVEAERVLTAARCPFVGKASPAHFFWGGFDLALTRFSGRPAPPRDGPAFQRDAYSHEVISHGFWPGAGRFSNRRFTPTPCRSPPGSRRRRCSPPKRSTTASSASSSFPMRPCEARQIRMPGFARSWIPRTSARRAWRDGIARSNGLN